MPRTVAPKAKPQVKAKEEVVPEALPHGVEMDAVQRNQMLHLTMNDIEQLSDQLVRRFAGYDISDLVKHLRRARDTAAYQAGMVKGKDNVWRQP